MELRLVETSGNTLEIEVLGENETLLNALKAKLLADDQVDLAEYIIEHPDLANPKVHIHTAKGDAVAALKRALKTLQKEYKDFEKALDEAVPEDAKRPAVTKQKAA